VSLSLVFHRARRSLVPLSLVVVAAAVVAEPAAAACPRLPASSGTKLGVLDRSSGGVRTTTVRVCTGGRRVVLRRAVLRRQLSARRSGVLVGAASAAKRRVAWIEARFGRRSREFVVNVASVSRRGAVRRLTSERVARDRARSLPSLGMVLTDDGDLAWLAPTPRGGRVVTWERGERRRTVARTDGSGLLLEDGRTLRWTKLDGTIGFHDLQHRPCPTRLRFKPVLTGSRVAITQATYSFDGGDVVTKVVRGCDLVTRRDLVVEQASEESPNTDDVAVIGVDRTWVLFAREEYARPEPCAQRWVQAVDIATGRRTRRSVLGTPACGPPGVPTPAPGSPLAITESGAAAWITTEAGVSRLLVAVRGEVRELDRAASITDLRAAGDAVAWTADGVARTAVP
jgi:hypothetical protein